MPELVAVGPVLVNPRYLVRAERAGAPGDTVVSAYLDWGPGGEVLSVRGPDAEALWARLAAAAAPPGPPPAG